jgi:hypothetical protein
LAAFNSLISSRSGFEISAGRICTNGSNRRFSRRSPNRVFDLICLTLVIGCVSRLLEIYVDLFASRVIIGS